jgi:hypothetical protein
MTLDLQKTLPFLWRKFYQFVFPALLMFVFSISSFSAFFEPMTISGNQALILSRSNFELIFFSKSPYQDSTGIANSFIDLQDYYHLVRPDNSIGLMSDTFMIIPQAHYDANVPFAVPNLRSNQCVVSTNALKRNRSSEGDWLKLTNSDKTFCISGALSAISGFESDHLGVVLLGFDQTVYDEWIKLGGERYVNFEGNISDFGFCNPIGAVTKKQTMISASKKQTFSLAGWEFGLALLAQFLFLLLVARIDYQDLQIQKTIGQRKGRAIERSFLKNWLTLGLPLLLVSLGFFFGSLEQASIGAILFGSTFLFSFLFPLLFSTIFIRRIYDGN